ncbi:hypothetical protein Droror1_Dr00011376 [Drosera rotundifolia]
MRSLEASSRDTKYNLRSHQSLSFISFPPLHSPPSVPLSLLRYRIRYYSPSLFRFQSKILDVAGGLADTCSWRRRRLMFMNTVTMTVTGFGVKGLVGDDCYGVKSLRERVLFRRD